MKNRWAETPENEIDQLVYQSRLVGAEESLVLWGGGNNSVKSQSTDLLGKSIDVMYIKSSGSDMKTIVPKEFPAVRLDYIEPLRTRPAERNAEMSDQEMVDYLARCLVDPSSRRPSIETLLHAFLPARAVLHTHADAILALTNTRGRESMVRDCFGDSVITVPYLRPGFRLSRDVTDAFESKPDAEGLVLMNHGLITWGETAREAYEKHIALVSRAEQFLLGVGGGGWELPHPTPHTPHRRSSRRAFAAPSAPSVPSSSNSTAARTCSAFLPAMTRSGLRRSDRLRPITCSTRNAFRCFSTRATMFRTR